MAAGGWLGWFMGGCDRLLHALIAFVVIDYLTGVMSAFADHTLSSEVGFRGICRKMLIFLLVGMANILDVMRGWLGFSEANGKFKEIIDLYNNVKPLPRGYAMQYSDECCDTCVSAAEIKAGCSELIGRECGVEEHVKIFKKLWIWIEDGTITPEPGYAIVYNLDKAVQPNGGYSDHIGFVEKVSGGMVTAIEGNRGEKVARRVIPLGWGYIRGYAAPQYEKAVNGNGGNPGTGKKSVEALAKEVLAGKWGERRGQKEETAGCGI